jgi:hypothetical protein
VPGHHVIDADINRMLKDGGGLESSDDLDSTIFNSTNSAIHRLRRSGAFPAPDMTPEKAFPPQLADRLDFDPAIGIFPR